MFRLRDDCLVLVWACGALVRELLTLQVPKLVKLFN